MLLRMQRGRVPAARRNRLAPCPLLLYWQALPGLVALRLKPRPESLNLRAKGCNIARIIKNIIGLSGLFSVGNLVRQPIASIGLDGTPIRGVWCDPCDIPRNLEIVGRCHHDDPIDAAAPIDKWTVFFAARASVANDFKNQRRFKDGDGSRIANEDFIHPSALRFNHRRMHEGIQFLEAAMTESKIGEVCTIETAIRIHDLAGQNARRSGRRRRGPAPSLHGPAHRLQSPSRRARAASRRQCFCRCPDHR